MQRSPPQLRGFQAAGTGLAIRTHWIALIISRMKRTFLKSSMLS